MAAHPGSHLQRRPDSKDTRQALAASLAAAASLALLALPLYAEVELSADGPGQTTYSTLLETVGPPVLLPLLIPIVLTALPLQLRGRIRKIVAVATTAGLAIFIAIGSASIGWFYVPALAAAVAAIVASRKPLLI